MATTYPAVRFVGGGARSSVWAQVLADVTGRRVEQVSEPRHATTRGAGFLGLAATGAITLDQVDDLVRVTQSFEPTPGSGSLFDARLATFQSLHSTFGSLGSLSSVAAGGDQ